MRQALLGSWARHAHLALQEQQLEQHERLEAPLVYELPQTRACAMSAVAC
jgi:hypothetical protein